MKHLEGADLVELALLDVPEDVRRQHLQRCSSCTLRFTEVRTELADDRAMHHEEVAALPATFWTRQRMAVSRTVRRRLRNAVIARLVAAAAVILLIAAGALFNRPPDAVVVESTSPVVSEIAEVPPPEISSDPWESEELSDYQTLVDWESWAVEESKGRSNS